MEARLLLQPFSRDRRLGVALADRARSATHLWLMSAWAQESGLKHLDEVVNALHSRGGKAEAILGVDQGIATTEGLTLALKIFDAVYLFHDGERTFHPKLYVIENTKLARLIIGSGNLTQGGLFDNFETSVALDLDRSDKDDAKIRNGARAYFDRFLSDGMPFRQLNVALIKELRDEGVVVSTKERGRTEMTRRRHTEPPLRRIFGGGVQGLPTAPSVTWTRPSGSGSRGRSRASTRTTSASPTTTKASRLPASTVVISWWRQLTASDAMRKASASHQRRYVILNKEEHPIDQTEFFKKHFFSGVAWSQQMMRSFRGQPPRTKEIAIIPFDVYVERRHLGVFNMTVDHSDSRVARQRNSPTWLNWSSLRDEIARSNYFGWYLLLERLANGSFRLTLTKSHPGTAVIPPAARAQGRGRV